jgi:GDP/UDP-N,N'-diacetylbacillosamine 2-epimerase (hydrolysing)
MRKICIFTSTRADWGLLRGLAEEIREHQDLELQLLVSGSHLSAKFGMTVSEIEDAGFDVTTRVNVLKYDDSAQGVCRTMGVALPGYSDALSELKPDLLVVLGDRYETLCVAVAAQISRIPVAHIHGGETTEGAVDESFRHAITKMSHVHFPACEVYRQRIIQLGENPDRVFNVGALGVENIRKIPLMDREALEASLGFPLDQPFFLVTFHPVTLEEATAGEQVDELFAALNQYSGHRVIFTKANADTDGEVINAGIDSYVAEFPDRCLAVASLGLIRYLSAMKLCAAVVGNSSSGILEAPSFHVPTVNIGDRQKGRVRAQSVLDCEPDRLSIQSEINRALTQEFIQSLKGSCSPFEKADTALSIVGSLAKVELQGIIKKSFFDIKTDDGG